MIKNDVQKENKEVKEHYNSFKTKTEEVNILFKFKFFYSTYDILVK